MMSKVSREFQQEGASLAKSQEDKLVILLKKLPALRSQKATYNTVRKKALEVRQNMITQREAAGLSKDSNEGRKVIEGLFPIPAAL